MTEQEYVMNIKLRADELAKARADIASLRAENERLRQATQSDEERARRLWMDAGSSLENFMQAIASDRASVRLAAAKKMRERCEDVAREHAELAGDGNGRAHIIADAIAELPLDE